MSPKLSILLSSPGFQYLVGVLINCSYLLILISHNTSYQNIQLPEGIYADNLWKGTDISTYVQPARNFIQYGVFGSGTIPDYHRTVGYPLFLALFMMLFGTHWHIFALVSQAMLFALMYPLLTRVSTILFSSSNNTIAASFLFFILSGVYIVNVPVVLTDMFFTVFFTIGFWLGLESIVKKSYIYLLLHIVFVGYSAQIRPSLSLYPIVNLFIFICMSVRYNMSRDRKIYLFAAVSLITLLLICNAPSMRNYRSHGFFRPTDILSHNLLITVREILIGVGKLDEYREMQQTVENSADIKKKMQVQEEMAMKTYAAYPLTTLQNLVRNAIAILARSHWPIVAQFWGYSFMDNFHPEHMPIKKLMSIYYIEILFNLIYLIIYLLFMAFLARNFKVRNFTLLLMVCIFIAYFLIPNFIFSRWAGSRMRLPVEGLIVIMAVCEFENRFETFKGKLLWLTPTLRCFRRATWPARCHVMAEPRTKN